VFAFTAVFAIGSGSETTLLVPIFLGIAILAAIALLRNLQTAAFNSIQLASILEQVSQRGREVIEGVHPEILTASDPSRGLSDDHGSPVVEMPPDGRDVLWPQRSSTVQTLDVPGLVRVAEHEGARIHLCVVPGETIFHQSRRAVVVGGPNLPDAEILKALNLGSSAPSIRIQRSRCACSPISRYARCPRLSTTRPPLFKHSTRSPTSYASSSHATLASKSWTVPIAHPESC
jgi:hypothetical protein